MFVWMCLVIELWRAGCRARASSKPIPTAHNSTASPSHSDSPKRFCAQICPNSCSGHGTCDLQTAECTCGCEENGDGYCETGYFGPACSKVICNATSCGDCTSTPYCTWCEASHQCLTGSPNGGNRPFIVTYAGLCCLLPVAWERRGSGGRCGNNTAMAKVTISSPDSPFLYLPDLSRAWQKLPVGRDQPDVLGVLGDADGRGGDHDHVLRR